MNNARTDLKTGPVNRHLVRLTIPMIWGIAAVVSFQLVDTYYVSLLGTVPLAAMTFTFPVTFFVFSIIMGFGIATSSVISRLIGEGREEDVKRVATHSLMLVFLVGIIFAAGGYLLRDVIFEAMGADKNIRPLIHQYMTIWFFGVPFMAAPFVGNSAMRASGSANAPAVIMVSASLLNAVLAYLLVFGYAGFPRLELQGAAIATVISNVFAMSASVYFLAVRCKILLPLSRIGMHAHEFGDSARRILFIAIPAGLTSAVAPVINSIVIGLLATFGTEAVAAFGIATRIEAFGMIILMALAVGMGPIIGQNFGAKNFDRVHATLRSAIGFSIFWSIGFAAILVLFGESIASEFSADATVIYYAVLSFQIIAPSYMFMSLVNGWASAFNAMGKPQMSVYMTVIRMILLMIPAVIIGAKLGGVPGIFIAIAAVNVVTGLAFHFWSRSVCLALENGAPSAIALKTP